VYSIAIAGSAPLGINRSSPADSPPRGPWLLAGARSDGDGPAGRTDELSEEPSIRTLSDTDTGGPLSADRPDADRRFRVDAPFESAGDQPGAIEEPVEGYRRGMAKQTLLGVTGSGETNTVSWVVDAVGGQFVSRSDSQS